MRFLSRLSDLVSMHLHTLLDQAEDPERMLTHLLQDMENGLIEAQQRAVQALAAERRLARELEHQRTRRDHWQQQALFALKMSRDDLARRALGHKLDHDGLVLQMEEQHRTAQDLCLKVKAAVAKQQQRLAEARGRFSLLVIRQRTAQVRVDVECLLACRPSSMSARFDLLERRLAEREDELNARADLSRDDDIDFEELKRREQLDAEMIRMQTRSATQSAEDQHSVVQ